MAEPLVSVIIPTYNQPAMLAMAIDSVLAQTLRDREIIIIDDGCTDDTVERLKKYGDAIRVVSQVNGGIGVARNRGIDEARGKYVAPLDHDDYWMAQKLQTQVDFMESHPQCVAVTCPFAAASRPDAMAYDPAAVTGPDRILRRPFLHMAQGRVVMGTSALLFDRRRAAGVRYGELRGAIEDVQVHISLIARGPVGLAGDRILSIWRDHEQNSSRNLANYFNDGINLLRSTDARGEWSALSPENQSDLKTYLAQVGRIACVGMLLQGRRATGLRLYLREAPWQVREKRLSFLALYPAMAMLPTSMVWRRVRSSQNRVKK